MGTPYTGNPESFPIATTLPDDGDDIDATNDDVGYEASIDQAAFLARRVVPGGRLVHANASTLAALSTLTGMVDKDTRHVPGFGLYIFRTGTTHDVDGVGVVAGSGTPAGQWFHVDYLQRFVRYVDGETVRNEFGGSGGSFILSTATKNAPDPSARNPGNVGVVVVSSSKTYTVKKNDFLRLSYALPFYVWQAGDCDMVASVGYWDSLLTTYSFPGEAQPVWEHLAQIIPYPTGSVQTLTRSAWIYTPADYANPQGFALIVAENLKAHGALLQGATLSIEQYRVIL